MSSYQIEGGNYEMVSCYTCGVFYLIPQILERAAQEKKPNRSIHCPNGHSWHYVGETEAEKMRRERDIARQQVARVEEEVREARMRAERAEKASRLLKKRAASGVCPCCKRTVSQMAAHMKTKHPEYVAENVVPMQKQA